MTLQRLVLDFRSSASDAVRPMQAVAAMVKEVLMARTLRVQINLENPGV